MCTEECAAISITNHPDPITFVVCGECDSPRIKLYCSITGNMLGVQVTVTSTPINPYHKTSAQSINYHLWCKLSTPRIFCNLDTRRAPLDYPGSINALGVVTRTCGITPSDECASTAITDNHCAALVACCGRNWNTVSGPLYNTARVDFLGIYVIHSSRIITIILPHNNCPPVSVRADAWIRLAPCGCTDYHSI